MDDSEPDISIEDGPNETAESPSDNPVETSGLPENLGDAIKTEDDRRQEQLGKEVRDAELREAIINPGDEGTSRELLRAELNARFGEPGPGNEWTETHTDQPDTVTKFDSDRVAIETYSGGAKILDSETIINAGGEFAASHQQTLTELKTDGLSFFEYRDLDQKMLYVTAQGLSGNEVISLYYGRALTEEELVMAEEPAGLSSPAEIFYDNDDDDLEQSPKNGPDFTGLQQETVLQIDFAAVFADQDEQGQTDLWGIGAPSGVPAAHNRNAPEPNLSFFGSRVSEAPESGYLEPVAADADTAIRDERHQAISTAGPERNRNLVPAASPAPSAASMESSLLYRKTATSSARIESGAQNSGIGLADTQQPEAAKEHMVAGNAEHISAKLFAGAEAPVPSREEIVRMGWSGTERELASSLPVDFPPVIPTIGIDYLKVNREKPIAQMKAEDVLANPEEIKAGIVGTKYAESQFVQINETHYTQQEKAIQAKLRKNEQKPEVAEEQIITQKVGEETPAERIEKISAIDSPEAEEAGEAEVFVQSSFEPNEANLMEAALNAQEIGTDEKDLIIGPRAIPARNISTHPNAIRRESRRASEKTKAANVLAFLEQKSGIRIAETPRENSSKKSEEKPAQKTAGNPARIFRPNFNETRRGRTSEVLQRSSAPSNSLAEAELAENTAGVIRPLSSTGISIRVAEMIAA